MRRGRTIQWAVVALPLAVTALMNFEPGRVHFDQECSRPSGRASSLLDFLQSGGSRTALFIQGRGRLHDGAAADCQGNGGRGHGPFGQFTLHRLCRYRRMVWIGAGIGVTPFLSMLAFEASNDDFRRIWLFYAVRQQEDAVYEREIEQRIAVADSYVDYVQWVSSERGPMRRTRSSRPSGRSTTTRS